MSDLPQDQTARAHDDQPGENLDADKVPEEFPDRPTASLSHGTTVAEQREGESLDGRLAREEPEVGSGVAPVDADDTTATPLQADLDEEGRDREKDLVSERPVAEPHVDDSGHPHVDAPAEEQAVRVVEDGDVPGAVEHRAVRDRP